MLVQIKSIANNVKIIVKIIRTIVLSLDKAKIAPNIITPAVTTDAISHVQFILTQSPIANHRKPLTNNHKSMNKRPAYKPNLFQWFQFVRLEDNFI